MKPLEPQMEFCTPVPGQICQNEPLSPQDHCSSSDTTNTATHSYDPAKNRFMSALSLNLRNGSVQIHKTKRNEEDVSIDLGQDFPVAPIIPQNPKLLLSHLCGSKSHEISLLINGERSPLDSSLALEAYKECHNTEEMNLVNETELKAKILHFKFLYGIDLTSPLGHIVSKHIKSDPSHCVISDVENHCLTSLPENSTAVFRLRERRIMYPVTFKCDSGKLCTPYVHLYNFTRRQKSEFMRRVNTGLNKNSRSLFKKMKPCSVKLTRVTKAEFRRWMPSKNNVTVNVKLLSAEEIAYWTSSKMHLGSNSCSHTLHRKNVHDCKEHCGLSFVRSPSLMDNFILKGRQIELTRKARTVDRILLEFINMKNSSLETENTPGIIPCLNFPNIGQIPSWPKKIHRLPDITNIDVDSKLKYSEKSVLTHHTMKNYRWEALKNYITFLSPGLVNCPSIPTVDSHILDFDVFSKFFNPKVKVTLMENKIYCGSNCCGPMRSGIYDVHMRISDDGEIIRKLEFMHQSDLESR